MKKVFTTSSSTQTQQLGVRLAKQIQHGVVGLQGNLGSGKTTFAQGFARGLGITEKILSPTFVIVKQYGNFYHIDCYRIEHSKDMLALGWDNLVSDPKNIILVEWPERIKDILPEHKTMITFTGEENNKRTIVVV